MKFEEIIKGESVEYEEGREWTDSHLEESKKQVKNQLGGRRFRRVWQIKIQTSYFSAILGHAGASWAEVNGKWTPATFVYSF